MRSSGIDISGDRHIMSVSDYNDIVVLDIGGTHIRVGHIHNGCLSTEFTQLESSSLCVSEAHRQLASIIELYSKQHNLKLQAAVLGLPAMLDRENDVISHCNNIPQLQGQGLTQFLSASLNCTVILEQDITLQVLGEWRAGVAHKQKSVFGVYFGTGIGAAFLINGSTEPNFLQDIQAGHIPIMAQGKQCPCGNKDCIEAYASGHTLIAIAKQTGYPVEQLFARWKQRDADAALRKELNQFILYQAYMLATICTLFTPDVMLVGGGIPKMSGYPKKLLIEKTRAHLQKPYPAESVRFEWASLGNNAPLYGALALLERLPLRKLMIK